MLITPEVVRGAARVRAVADFVVDLMKRHRKAIAGIDGRAPR